MLASAVGRRPLVVAGILSPVFVVAFSLALPAADDCVQQTNLVSNDAGAAANVDSNLKNAWGVAVVGSTYWVSDNATGVATSYDPSGAPTGTVITIPAAGGTGTGAPTGVVANRTQDFQELGAVPATLLFSTEDGLIVAWRSTIDGTLGRVVADRSSLGAVYKGLAVGNDGNANFLYAADFHNGRVDVFDSSFNVVPSPGGFADSTVPKGFAPFNVSNVGGALYVTYAKQDAAKKDDVRGHGLGLVNVFDANGFRLRRFVAKGRMDAPWAVTMAPATFGSYARRLVVGNFGDGTVQTFDLASGRYRGPLRGTDGKPLAIDGLWGLIPGGATDTLWFASGPNDEADGLFGKLNPGTCAHGK